MQYAWTTMTMYERWKITDTTFHKIIMDYEIKVINAKYYRLLKPNSRVLWCLAHGLQQVSMGFGVIQLYRFDTT